MPVHWDSYGYSIPHLCPWTIHQDTGLFFIRCCPENLCWLILEWQTKHDSEDWFQVGTRGTVHAIPMSCKCVHTNPPYTQRRELALHSCYLGKYSIYKIAMVIILELYVPSEVIFKERFLLCMYEWHKCLSASGEICVKEQPADNLFLQSLQSGSKSWSVTLNKWQIKPGGQSHQEAKSLLGGWCLIFIFKSKLRTV